MWKSNAISIELWLDIKFYILASAAQKGERLTKYEKIGVRVPIEKAHTVFLIRYASFIAEARIQSFQQNYTCLNDIILITSSKIIIT